MKVFNIFILTIIILTILLNIKDNVKAHDQIELSGDTLKLGEPNHVVKLSAGYGFSPGGSNKAISFSGIYILSKDWGLGAGYDHLSSMNSINIIPYYRIYSQSQGLFVTLGGGMNYLFNKNNRLIRPVLTARADIHFANKFFVGTELKQHFFENYFLTPYIILNAGFLL